MYNSKNMSLRICRSVDDRKEVSGVFEYLGKVLLKKLNIKKCRFLEYQVWVMTNFLFSTGLRQHSLIYLQIKDVDLYNAAVHARGQRILAAYDPEADVFSNPMSRYHWTEHYLQ